jgi:hypothetical protein
VCGEVGKTEVNVMSHLMSSLQPDAATDAPLPSMPIGAQVPEAWLRQDSSATNIALADPPAVLTALVAAGFLQVTDRSDPMKIAEAFMKMADRALGDHIRVAFAEEDAAKAAENNSWGMGPRGR